MDSEGGSKLYMPVEGKAGKICRYGNKYLSLYEKNTSAMQTTNFTDLRKNLKSYLDAVVNDSETVIINREGGTGAVLMSLDEYNAIKETEYLMSSPATMEAIRQGERDIAEGRYISIENEDELKRFLDSI